MLERLVSIGDVKVTGDPESPICSSLSLTETEPIAITFTTEFGDLPLLRVRNEELSGAEARVEVNEAVKGTKEDLVCAAHGICDEATGHCTCFRGFTSSDGDGSGGLRGDCGNLDSQCDNSVPWRDLLYE